MRNLFRSCVWGLALIWVSLESREAFAQTGEGATKQAGLTGEEEPKPTGQAKNFIGLGPILGLTAHTNTPPAGVLGFEISYVRYPGEAFGFGLGVFAQGQSVGLRHARWALGTQLNFMMFGVELGGYLEEGDYGKAKTLGLHASPFVSIGFFSAAFRIGVPVTEFGDKPPYGIDLGLVCAIKAPIALDGQLFGIAFH